MQTNLSHAIKGHVLEQNSGVLNYQHVPFHPRPIKSSGLLIIACLAIRRRWMSFSSHFQIRGICPVSELSADEDQSLRHLQVVQRTLESWAAHLSSPLCSSLSSRASTGEQRLKEPRLNAGKENLPIKSSFQHL